MLVPVISKGFAAWAMYSFAHRRAMKSTFAGMKTISNLRPEGNRTLIPQLLQSLPRLNGEQAADYCVPLLGDDRSITGDSEEPDCFYRLGKELMVRYGPNCTGVFGLSTSPQPSLAKLVEGKKIGRFVTNNMQFLLWMTSLLNETADGVSPSAIPPPLTDSTYRLAFRDYCNYEEEWGVMCNRGGIENMIMSYDGSRVTMRSDGECRLLDAGRLFGIIPFKTTWKGKLGSDNVIDWYTTRTRMGWKRFWSKTFDRPPASEKLRKANWKAFVPKECSGDSSILIFQREGKGRLCFALESTEAVVPASEERVPTAAAA